MSFNPSNGFASFNSVNAAKGMAGTTRSGTATFSGAPSASTASGMTPQLAQPSMPTGSSYTRGAGMQPDANGVNPGQAMPMADVGQQAPQMTAAQMQDPANAALAGYAFSATQDQPVQASQQPQQVASNGVSQTMNPTTMQYQAGPNAASQPANQPATMSAAAPMTAGGGLSANQLSQIAARRGG